MLSENYEEVRFGDFTLKKKTLDLYRGRRRLSVQPKVLDLLIALVERPDEMIPRSVLCDRLWPGAAVSSEESLNTLVRKLRRLLRDNSQKPRFIETVPKRGYRFIAAVHNGKPPQATSPATPTSMLQTAGLVTDDKAREAYLRGYFYWNKRSPAALQQALSCFQDADRWCPNNAAIRAAIAQSYLMLASQSVLPPLQAIPEARTAAIDAIRLDHQNATGFTALAWIRAVYVFDCRGAQAEFQEAIRLDPSNSYTYQAYSFVLTALGKHDESISLLDRAATIDPVSLTVQALRGYARYFARQFDDAIRLGYQVVKLNPEFGIARYYLAQALIEVGEISEASSQLETAAEILGATQDVYGMLAYAFLRGGKENHAEAVLHRLKFSDAPSAYHKALIATAHGDHGAALQLLRRAYDEKSQWFAMVGVDPKLDPLRTLPDFERIKRLVIL